MSTSIVRGTFRTLPRTRPRPSSIACILSENSLGGSAVLTTRMRFRNFRSANSGGTPTGSVSSVSLAAANSVEGSAHSAACARSRYSARGSMFDPRQSTTRLYGPVLRSSIPSSYGFARQSIATPARIAASATALRRRFASWNTAPPRRNVSTTLERRIMLRTDMRAPGTDTALK